SAEAAAEGKAEGSKGSYAQEQDDKCQQNTSQWRAKTEEERSGSQNHHLQTHHGEDSNNLAHDDGPSWDTGGTAAFERAVAAIKCDGDSLTRKASRCCCHGEYHRNSCVHSAKVIGERKDSECDEQSQRDDDAQ